ncbi:electron transport complex protein RnfA [Haloplasma contractile]|uniref:Ion-translocating oxidoreductase complex subunit A n=1 Tax=Haloplasma contractile SSD-17B TaxID=1033810 RepID=U2EGV2_9MOLU|nr:RnfABCDGE type electron transport complex subunit A [Haloplasma contractile]ERJ13836.1 Na-translocating NADH-quinone reductase subunit D protein [Haloplasma contractile SSD-17B]
MGDLLALGIFAILVQNIILAQFLGICPFLGVSKKSKSAIGMGVAVVFVMVLSSTITYGLYELILKEDALLVSLDISFMVNIVFILVISSVVQFVEMAIKKIAPAIYKMLGIFLPLITTNCAILGVALINVRAGYEVDEMIVFSLASAIGFTLVIYIFSTIRERLNYANVPENFKGAPIALITAGLMAIAFMGFQGIITL